jgi:magnesium-transporting ATPase (P-type)
MDDIVRIYVKGAPEIVVFKCTKTISQNGGVSPLEDDEQTYIINQIMNEKYAKNGNRCMCFAYKDMNTEDFENLK